MAAATSDWDDVDEKFLQCQICLGQLNEPKLLTCLHRFCSNCLEKLLATSRGVIKCPECWEESSVPVEGVTGFKTDFHLKNIIELVCLKKSLVENKQTQECYSCSKQMEVTAYCLKCSGFFCKGCHQFHRKSNLTKDHLLSVLDLNDPSVHKLGMTKLAQLVDSPRCPTHPENIVRLCCATCNYAQICVICVHGDHVNHDIKDIHSQAKEKKVELEDSLALLRGCKDIIYKLRQEVKIVAKNTNSYSEKQTQMLKDCNRHQRSLLDKIRKNISLKCDKRRIEIEKKYEEAKATLNTDTEREIQQIQAKYALISEEIDNERADHLKKVEESSIKELALLATLEDNANTRFEDSEKSLQILKNEADLKCIATSERSESIIKKYENLTVTASSMLAADNDWTAVRCIPDICSLVKPLLEDMTSTFTELTVISQSPPSEVLLPVNVSHFDDSYRASVVKIQAKDDANSSIMGMVNAPGQGIIVIRQDAREGGYLRCINIHGKVLWSDFSETYFTFPQSDVQVYKMKAAATWFPDAVTTLEKGNQRKSFWGVQLHELIDSWPSGMSLQCVAVDPLNKRIFAGFQNCQDIYVLDDALKIVTIFSLPSKAKYPSALAVSVEGLIICDTSGQTVFSTTFEGEHKSDYLIPLPGRGSSDNLIPQSVCVDSKDNVFVLMERTESEKFVVQYCKSGGHPVAYRAVGPRISHIAVTMVDQEEMLVLASTRNSLQIYLTEPNSDNCESDNEGSHEKRDP